MKRLTPHDWALLDEALQMLSLDYEGNHPNQARLEELMNYCVKRACFKTEPKEESSEK